MSRTGQGIAFGESSWGAYSQPEMSRWAQRGDISPRATRVLFAAMGRHDRHGHSRFAPGELASHLGSINETTGEILPAAKAAVSDAISVAKRLGFVGEESTARCLVLRSHAFQRASGPGLTCPVHG